MKIQKNSKKPLIDSAYQFTQPKKILDYKLVDDYEEKFRSQFRKCRHCGLKICHCQDYKKK